ncbi:MAG: LTA synthase family protein [Clostridia bacterium]|nr:LTA synthase family protein [Clostridia bacterium]
MIKFNKKEFGLKKSLIIIAILSIFSVVFQAIIQIGFEKNNLHSYLTYIAHPTVFIFNFIPIFLLTTLLYFILNSISISYIITNIPLTILLIINHYKVYFLDSPLMLNDFASSKEALSISKNYKLEFNLRIFIFTLVMLLLFVFLIRFIRATRLSIKSKIWGITLSSLLIVLSYVAIYTDTDLYKTIAPVKNEYYDVDVVNSKGLLYSLLSKENIKSFYKKPENYNSKISNLITDYTKGSSSTKNYPNVIAIMSEAFFDPTSATNLNFYEGKYPLKNFDRLCKDGYYGRIIVPGFAGATSSTEFEFITGMNITTIDSSLPDVYKTHINQNLYSLVKLFKDINYKTIAIHPGHEWFYNRKNVYNFMGFDKSIFKTELPSDIEKINYYISDKVTTDLIINNYKKHLETNKEQGYFNLTVTIQNHGPYISTVTEREPSVIKPDDMDDTLYNIVNNYIGGLSDADELLGKVADFTNTLDVPTVIVFFGDHLPYWDSELEAYKDIGYGITENTLESLNLKHSVPYVIWGNDAFIASMKEQGFEIKKGEGKEISSSFLGLELLKYINMDLPPFFNFLSNLEEKLQVITPTYYIKNKEFLTELPDEINELIDDYRIFEYHNLREQ